MLLQCKCFIIFYSLEDLETMTQFTHFAYYVYNMQVLTSFQ